MEKGGNALHPPLPMTTIPPLPHSRNNRAFVISNRKWRKMLELEKSLLVVPREKSGQGMVILDTDGSQQKVTEG